MLFNIYYINTSKVYEISMMINNFILKTIQSEKTSSFEKSSTLNKDASLSYLGKIKANLGVSDSERTTSSKKIVENIEIITTKSLLLRNVLEKAKKTQNLEEAHQGDLVRIDGIKLKLENEIELRQVKTLYSGALKGLTYEGLEISNLINSMIKDYSYVLTGSMNNKNVIIKIPIQFENEFENQYNIDDLLIGTVSILGVYKDKIKKTELKNTFSIMVEAGGQSKKPTYIEKSDAEKQVVVLREEDIDDYYFIDTIAIIQEIYKDSEMIVKKKFFLFRLFAWIVSLTRKRK